MNLEPNETPIDELRADFRNFLYVVWKYLKLPVPTHIQYDIALFLMNAPQRSVIEAFRGVGKSWITSAYVLWVLLNDPQKKVLVVSASKERADSFTIFTKRLINEMDELAVLRPNPGQRDSSIAFDVGPAMAAHAPSVKSVGITGQLAGSRADLIVADDIETLKNSLTQVMRDRLGQAISEFDAILTPKPDSRIIYLGTPQSEQSIYNLLPERGYTVQIWPARMPADCSIYHGSLAPYIETLGLRAGEPVDPDRFDNEDLDKREASYGRSGFNLQFMLNTTLSDADRRPLKLSDLIIMDCPLDIAPIKLSWGRGSGNLLQDVPNIGLQNDHLYGPMFQSTEWAEYTGTVMAIDPSGKGSDDTGYAIVKMLHGMLFVVAAGGLPGGYDDDVLNNLAILAKKYAVNYLVIESNLGLGMFASLLKPVLVRHGYPITIEEVHHNIQKERRILETLEPVMNQHRLVVDKQLVMDDYRQDRDVTYKLFYQMTRLTRDRGSLAHDDAIDVLSMAVAYWVAHMARNNDTAADEYRNERLMEELEKFQYGVLGMPVVGNNYTDNW
jgi:hypothetical protein